MTTIADPAKNIFGVWQVDPTAFPLPEPDYQKYKADASKDLAVGQEKVINVVATGLWPVESLRCLSHQ